MNAVADNYDIYYADKLWNLLPAVYRAMDTDQYGVAGPLREMVNRIGAQGAVLRRSIDRMWEDQSIETCDDWLIPYIADLLATNLVANLDSAGQRLDVANTIYYRRRKGTVAILEEIAANITGWEAKVVECFRRMARTRHGLDPAIGMPLTPGDDIYQLQLAEGLVGQLTRTGIGGFADLRNVYGASRTGTAFDEYFHTADFRRGVGRVGWYDIPRIAVFLWRLKSYKTAPTTPVAVLNCPGWFTFDPTGRDIALFAAGFARHRPGSGLRLRLDLAHRGATTHADKPEPARLQRDQRRRAGDRPALSVVDCGIPDERSAVEPVRDTGDEFDAASRPRTLPMVVVAAVGLAAAEHLVNLLLRLLIEYRRRPVRSPRRRYDAARPCAIALSLGRRIALASLPATQGTVTISDSLTYAKVGNVSVDGALTIRADNLQRPLIRMPHGGGGGAECGRLPALPARRWFSTASFSAAATCVWWASLRR